MYSLLRTNMYLNTNFNLTITLQYKTCKTQHIVIPIANTYTFLTMWWCSYCRRAEKGRDDLNLPLRIIIQFNSFLTLFLYPFSLSSLTPRPIYSDSQRPISYQESLTASPITSCLLPWNFKWKTYNFLPYFFRYFLPSRSSSRWLIF